MNETRLLICPPWLWLNERNTSLVKMPCHICREDLAVSSDNVPRITTMGLSVTCWPCAIDLVLADPVPSVYAGFLGPLPDWIRWSKIN